MTAQQWIRAIESYYGPYRDGVRSVVLAYLRGFSGPYLEELQRRAILTYSTEYGVTPDVAMLERLRGEVADAVRLQGGRRGQDLGRRQIGDGTEDRRADVVRMLRRLARHGGGKPKKEEELNGHS